MGSRKSSSGQGSRPNRGNLGGVRSDGASTVAKIGLIATLLGALIAGTATVGASLINKESNHTLPGVATMPQLAEEKTVTEQVQTSNPAGAPTFPDSRAFKRQGPWAKPGQEVEVACRFLDPKAAPNWQSDWWYVVVSPPWNGQFYTPAIFYLNGDPPEGPYGTDVDGRVPVCQ
jgi:hypothetical protein